jgi:saccharopine dehydrogenase (NAD+, L-lysine-forming)
MFFYTYLPYIFLIIMKAIVFGGAGVEGSYVVKRLSKTDIFSEISIADINKVMGKNKSSKYENVDYIHLDATDKKNVKKSLEGADVAINCIGPFYKFAPIIMEAAIESGVNIVDICDDYDMTRTLIDNYHEKALDAGVTSIVGLGASPGITNILAALAAKNLTSVKEIGIYVVRGIKEEAGSAIPYHMMHCWLGKIPIYQNCEFKMVNGLADGKEYITFPEPFGQVPVYYFGHPESVTIPRYIKGVENVACKGSFFPPEFRKTLLQIQDLGLITEDFVYVNGNKIKPVDFLAGYLGSLEEKIIETTSNIPSGGSVIVKVSGEKNSEPVTFQFSGTSRMREGTATPASIGAEMIAKREIKSPGVQAPEACIPPELFIEKLMREEMFGDTWITVTKKITGLDTFFSSL